MSSMVLACGEVNGVLNPIVGREDLLDLLGTADPVDHRLGVHDQTVLAREESVRVGDMKKA